VGNDLLYRHSICLQDALLSEGVEFETLEGEKIKFRAEQTITPQTTRVFPGKGMPIYNEDPLAPLMMNHARGNFILKFQVTFPMMTSDQKDRLTAVLTQEDASEE
jgi:DnaJ-class molecular chaperone